MPKRQPAIPGAWTVLERQTPLHDRWLRVDAERVRTPDGVVLDPYYVIVERDWVAIVATRSDGRVLIVEQYRHAAGRVTWELPAGNLDPDEAPSDAARRELAEETGYRAAGESVSLGAFYPDPTRHTSRAHGFWMPVGDNAGAQQLDADEAIRVHAVEAAELDRAIADGRFCHAVHVGLLARARALGHVS